MVKLSPFTWVRCRVCETEKKKRGSDTAKVQSLARKPISNLQAKRRHARLVRRSGMTSESRVPYLFCIFPLSNLLHSFPIKVSLIFYENYNFCSSDCVYAHQVTFFINLNALPVWQQYTPHRKMPNSASAKNKIKYR